MAAKAGDSCYEMVGIYLFYFLASDGRSIIVIEQFISIFCYIVVAVVVVVVVVLDSNNSNSSSGSSSNLAPPTLT